MHAFGISIISRVVQYTNGAFYFVLGTGNNQETPGVFNPPASQMGEQYICVCVFGLDILKGNYNVYLMQAPFVHADIVIYDTPR